MEILGFQNSLLEFQEIHNHQKTFLTEKRKLGGGDTQHSYCNILHCDRFLLELCYYWLAYGDMTLLSLAVSWL